MATAREVWEFNAKGLNDIIADLGKVDDKLDDARGSAETFKGAFGALAVGEAIRKVFEFGSVAIESFAKSEQAIAQVKQGLESTGGTAGRTFDELSKQAETFSKNTLFGDDDILQDVTAQLLSFQNISGNVFDRTQAAALDLTEKLGGNLKTSALQLGKALNDPIAGIKALSSSGIQFTDEQKNIVAGLVATNRLADAQTLILDELARQTGGSASAAAATFSGQLQQTQSALMDAAKPLGEALIPLVLQFTEFVRGTVVPVLTNFAAWINTNRDAIIGIAATVGFFAAAVGIYIAATKAWVIATKAWVIVTKAMTVVQWALNVAILSNPYIAVIAGIIALIAVFVYLYNNVEIVRKYFDILGRAFLMFYDFYIKPLWEVLKNFAMWLIEKFGGAFSWIAKKLGLVGKAAKDLNGDLPITDGGVNPELGNPDSGFQSGLSPEMIAALVDAGQTSSGGGKNSQKGISEITAAAPKIFNINIGSLVSELTFHTTNLKDSESRIRDVVTRALLSAINDTQTAIE
jgi:hypothetical protein